MKLQLFLAGMLFGPAMAVSAQEVYSENFEGNPNDIINEGWRFYEMAGNPENYGVYSAVPQIEAIGIEGASMGAASFNMVNQVPTHVTGMDLAIVSPAINIPNGESHFHYRMGSVRIGANASSNYSMYILTEEEYESAPTPAQLKALLDDRWADDSATIANEITDNSSEMTDYAGQSIVIVFRMHNSPSNSILLFDNLRIVGGALGTDSFSADSFSVYPNPSNDIVTVTTNNAIIEAVNVTDINGRSIMSNKYENPTSAQVDLSGISSGIYMLTVSSDKGIATKKIVKQ